MTTKPSHLANLFPQAATSPAVDVPLPIAVSFPTPVAQAATAAVTRTVESELLYLDPWTIVIPDKPNRLPDAFETDRYEQLRASLQASGGNLEPIRAVRVKADPPRYELSFGERRVRGCRDLNLLVLAMVVDAMDEIDDYVDRIRENQGREDLCAWEFAQQIGHVLSMSNSPTQAILAQQLGVNASQISRALHLYQLPAELVSSFASPRQIRYEDIKPLRDAWRTAPDAVRAEIERIKKEPEPLEAAKVLKRISAASKPPKEQIASCKSSAKATEPQAIECDEMRVGEWSMTAEGTLAITIKTSMSDAQRDGMLLQVQAYLKKKVLKKPENRTQAEATSPQAPSDDVAGKEAA